MVCRPCFEQFRGKRISNDAVPSGRLWPTSITRQCTVSYIKTIPRQLGVLLILLRHNLTRKPLHRHHRSHGRPLCHTRDASAGKLDRRTMSVSPPSLFWHNGIRFGKCKNARQTPCLRLVQYASPVRLSICSKPRCPVISLSQFSHTR